MVTAAADGVDVVIAEAGSYRRAPAYRDGLVLLDKVTLMALTADSGRLALRERAIVALYYFEELTFAEIGRVLGVSESRACQLHGRAVKELRTVMQDDSA